jgi:hypothetical protein
MGDTRCCYANATLALLEVHVASNVVGQWVQTADVTCLHDAWRALCLPLVPNDLLMIKV